MKAISYAPEAWKYLNGIFCVYKPSEVFTVHMRESIILNLCKDLNEMEKRPPKDRVLLKGSLGQGKPFSVEMAPNYADHELVSGPRYQIQDVRMRWISCLGKRTSGIILFGVNDGCRHCKMLESSNLLCKYEVKGKLGCASTTFMEDGKIMERSTYGHVKQHTMDSVLASIQSSHQALAYQYSGINLKYQEAYELASKGLVRPSTHCRPLLYEIKCTKFEKPEFTLEIRCINATEQFLAELIHQIGIYVKSSAVCTQIRRTQFGYFTLEHALLRKHWRLEHILNNITLCRKIFGEEITSSKSAHFEKVDYARLQEAVQDMQKEAREEALVIA